MRRQFRFTFISRINTTKSSRQQQQQQKLLELFASRPYIHIAAASCLSVARSRSTSTSIYRYNLMIADIDFDTNDSEYVSLFVFFFSLILFSLHLSSTLHAYVFSSIVLFIIHIMRLVVDLVGPERIVHLSLFDGGWSGFGCGASYRRQHDRCLWELKLIPAQRFHPPTKLLYCTQCKLSDDVSTFKLSWFINMWRNAKTKTNHTHKHHANVRLVANKFYAHVHVVYASCTSLGA